jgi:hypothetical protein
MMSRIHIRNMKRAVQAGSRPGATSESVSLSKESSLSLLARSIEFGHGRLAVVRLVIAVQTGAEVTEAQWQYCKSVATSSRADETLRALYRDATLAVATSLH